MNQRLLPYLLLPARIIPGLLFLFSGFLKAVDPWGTAYKIEDYLMAFGISGLDVIALPLSILLSVVEMVLGAALLAALFLRVISTVTMALSGFFTLLTLWIALTNPVSDCGCFGDAIVLSNWATFFKNLGLILFTGILFIHRRTLDTRRAEPADAGWILLFFLLGVGFAVRNITHLPLFDFRPYRVGADLYGIYFEGREDVAAVSATRYIYEKEGRQEPFDAASLPDSSWQFVETRTIPGFTPSPDNPLLGFYIADADGVEKTDSVLNGGYVLLMVAEDLSRIGSDYMEKAKSYREYAELNGFDFFLLTSSSPNQIREFSSRETSAFRLLTADRRTLRTMIRSNPGLILLGSGVVLNKWHKNDFPEISEFGTNPTADALRKHSAMNAKATVGWLLCCGVLLAIAVAGSRKKRKDHVRQQLFF